MSSFDHPALGLPHDLRDAPLDLLLLQCAPVDVSLLTPEERVTVARIVSVDHVQILCPECNKPCWIGKAQRKALRDPRAKALCYICIAADPQLRLAAMGLSNYIHLDPRAGDVPRRSSSWMVTGDYGSS